MKFSGHHHGKNLGEYLAMKNIRIAVVSASFGGIDGIPSLPPHANFYAVFYTDKETLARSDKTSVASWDLVLTPDYPRKDLHSRLRAKYFKLQVHKLEETLDYEYLVWSDAGVSIRDPDFISRATALLHSLAPYKRFAAFPHPFRLSVQLEHDYIVSEIKSGNPYLTTRYANEDISGQLEFYRKQGWDTTGRLLCGGFWVVGRHPATCAFLDDWWDHNLRFSIQDQISMPIVLKKNFIEPILIDANLYDNTAIQVGNHDIVI